MTARLRQFHGGMHLHGHKQESMRQGLQIASLPAQLIVPLKQHIGEYNKPVVEIGDRVLKGQVIAEDPSIFCAPVHAPSSGIVAAIDYCPVPHPSGQSDQCIVIDVDGKDEAVDKQMLDPSSASAKQIVDHICRCGIVGLGGAAFPTSPKLARGGAQGITTLIINAVECEPYITCDDILMQNRSDEVVRGIGYLQTVLNPRNTLIGIEDNKPEALAALKSALAKNALPNTEIVVIPTIYPSGGEKQLIQILTGKEVPHGKLAFDVGLFCQNVGTCAAITAALENDQALISRIVTFAGDNVKHPGNWEVRIGTPISHLAELAGGYKNPSGNHLVMGGPMMGFSLSSDQVPIVKASNCILSMQQKTIPDTIQAHDECIRCSKCTDVCPANLLPQQLYWHARSESWDRIQEFHLFDCIECGCCSAVCPSRIPLVQYYRASKSEIRAAQKSQIKSDRARVRFEFREKRLLLKKQQDEERKRLKREALQKKKAGGEAQIEIVDPVQAALERVKARKKALQDEPQ